MKKLSLRKIKNLFSFANKGYKSDIKVAKEINAKLLSAYPHEQDSFIMEATPVIILITYKNNGIMSEFAMRFKNILCKFNIKYIESITDDTIDIVVSGYPSCYDRMLAMAGGVSLDPEYQKNPFISKVIECVTELDSSLFETTVDSIGIDFKDCYESYNDFISTVDSIMRNHDVGLETPAISILSMQKIDGKELKSTSLTQKDILSVSNMSFVVPSYIAESDLFDKAVYLVALYSDSSVEDEDGLTLCSMSINDFMDFILKTHHREVTEIVINLMENLPNHFRLTEPNGETLYINQNKIKLGLLPAMTEEEKMNAEAYDIDAELYADIDEDIEE